MKPTRYNPDEAPPGDLAQPTMERGQHYLFHSRNGDIWGQYAADTLIGNILIIAHLDRMKGANALCATIHEAGLKKAAVIPWLKATGGARSKSMWAVVLQNVTPIDLALATPFIPAEAAAKNPANAGRGEKGEAQKTRQADVFPRAAAHAAHAAPAAHVAERVLAMPATTFAFLLGSEDTAHAATVRDAFAAHLRNGAANTDWRREWTAWSAVTSNVTPVTPGVTAAVVAAFMAGGRGAILPTAAEQRAMSKVTLPDPLDQLACITL